MLRVRSRVVSLAAVGMLSIGLVWQGPAVASGDARASRTAPSLRHAAQAAFTSIRTVRLITGDDVRVMSRADGSVVASVESRKAAARVQTGADAYVFPKTPPFERRRLDPSLFDVSALADLDGARVPIVVEFASTDKLHPIDGLRLMTADGARHAGRMTVRGSYSSEFSGLDRRDLAGVTLIRRADVRIAPHRQGATHRLTVNITTRTGAPTWAIVFIENVRNSATFLQTPSTDENGQVTVDVPAGPYSVMAFSFSKLAIAPEFRVAADRTVGLNMGDATVKPEVKVPGFHPLVTVLSVGRFPERGFGFPLTFEGPRFFMRVQPVPPHVGHGSLFSGVSATLAPRGVGRRAVSSRLAVTADVVRGVPASLTYVHRRADFARVVDRFYGNGTPGQRATYVSSAHRYADFFTGEDLWATVPGRRVLLLQAGGGQFYQQTLLPQASPRLPYDLTQLISVRQSRTPGTSQTLTFARGPVGPGLERPYPYLRRSVTTGRLHGYLPLFTGAGDATTFSYVDARDGEWSLRRGSRLIDRGRHLVELDSRVPAVTRRYILRASSHPAAPSWRLSTKVIDVWSFRLERGRSAVPLLTPSYFPGQSMSGYLRPGRTSFRLAFHRLSPLEPKVGHVRVDLSTDDGRTWAPARLIRLGPSRFRVAYRNPAAHRSQRFMSFRVTGTDAHGDGVTETALRVYRLR